MNHKMWTRGNITRPKLLRDLQNLQAHSFRLFRRAALVLALNETKRNHL